MVKKSLLGSKHQSVIRDYMSRVTDEAFPKHRASEIAKKWDEGYWDGDRRTGYGGYGYLPGYWTPLADALIREYKLTPKSKVLDVGCGKGFLLTELVNALPGISVTGLDVSTYALENAHPTVKDKLILGSCVDLPFETNQFDLALSINVFHNLIAPELERALKEFKRVSKNSYLVVESYETELQKSNLLYWQLTCEAFLRPEEWQWWFDLTGYNRDYEFIYFD
jgi:protein-L-isoaspartate(D-aspartate) O-methyltransferase